MDALLDDILQALTEGATPDQRAAGARAAEAIAKALSAKPGEPLGAPPDATAAESSTDQAPAQEAATADTPPGGAPPPDTLDVLIAKLSSYLPDDAKPTGRNGQRLRVPFVPVPARKA